MAGAGDCTKAGRLNAEAGILASNAELVQSPRIGYEQAMAKDIDSGDPLQLLMQEWAHISTWFWSLLLGAAICLGVVQDPGMKMLGWVLLVSALGLPLLKLGPTLIILANELRKHTSRQVDGTQSDSDDGPEAPQFRR
jgi:hypothetical protein